MHISGQCIPVAADVAMALPSVQALAHLSYTPVAKQHLLLLLHPLLLLLLLLQMRAYRKDIADLLKSGKLDYAIIRVESVIREQLTLTGV